MEYALVTGSSSGLGLEIVHYLLEEGMVVFGASRSGTDIDHENFIDLEVDVRDETSVMEMFEKIGHTTYGLSLIVNNAGIFEMAPVIKTSSELFLDHFQTNCLGPFHILKYGYDFLIENQSHIVHLASIASKRGFSNISGYCASKFALNGLIESVREEWKELGVRFTTLYPGAIDTPLWDSITDTFEREKMMSVDEFLHIFDMVVKAPSNVQFPDITFLHKSGVID